MRLPAILSIITALALMVPGTCPAQEVLPITPPDSLPSLSAQQRPAGSAFIDELSGIGTIDDKTGLSITIDDVEYLLSPLIVYYDTRGEAALPGDFPLGSLAGFVLGDENEIISLWKIVPR